MWHLTFALTVLIATVAFTEVTGVSIPYCKRCSSNADCVNNSSCQCKTGYLGKPTFHCYNPNNSYCHILSDPTLRTFSGQHFKLQRPGSYQLVNTTMDRIARGSGKCDFLANVTLSTIDNRIYATEIWFKLTQRAGALVLPFTVRVVASLAGDVLVWTVYYLEKGMDNTPVVTVRSDTPLQVDTTRCELEYLNYQGFFLKIHISCCGINLGLRQKSNFDPSLVPGVFLELEPANNPVLTPNDGSLCERTF